MELFGRTPGEALDGAAFGREVERLLSHLGFSAVTNIDGAGDLGADLIAERGGVRWVFQCKYKGASEVSEDAVREVVNGLANYGASRAVVVTNRGFTASATAAAARFKSVAGITVDLWTGDMLQRLWEDDACADRFGESALRPYQADAFVALRHDLQSDKRALLVLATGLGKTVVAGTCIDAFIRESPSAKVLVLAHAKDLVDQLEHALWRHLTKHTQTQQLTGDSKPELLNGVTVATIQTAIKYIRNGYSPDFIFIDEAHHVGADSQYAELTALSTDSQILGVTATPWRGDRFDVEGIFGEASYKLGIEEGMRLGFLCDVDYRLFADNIDWDVVNELSSHQYSIADLNTRLFLPQRDEQIRDELLQAWNTIASPRAIVFCQSIEHAERLVKSLVRVSQWSSARLIHSGMQKRERQLNLMEFRAGKCPLLVAVDVLNEGVDVPDVNLVCFARVTHSRRIFVQQLGRGLRLSPGKDRVVVLDFISDLRRVAAVMNLRKQISGDATDVYLPSAHKIEFTDMKAESLMTEWIKDAADLETANDQARLNFLGNLS